jgi:enamine deaminase RidA (YjgF/YER057c/UK114 family)
MEGIPSVPIFDNGRLIGQTFEDSSAKYCLLGGIYPSDLKASPAAQAEEVFGMIERALASAGMDFRQVVRTWFYNDGILAWYAGFNRVRTAFFKDHGVTLMPASTGIGAPNIVGAALVAKVVAVLPKTAAVQVRKAESPLQCDAFDYGSAFSRAIEVAGPLARTLYISGTASIEPGGKTVHVGNAALQIAKTMEVVEAILHKAGMGLGDTTRAISYFRHPEHIALWRDFCRTKALNEFPVVEAACTICRDDLLFEIELDAAREKED